ncbi:potassium channel family protein [Subtercola endophyticus]|uniref:potassium channel family protein n=1 Tax=Subtercola endophyticus TaxID=2895559 RepID=UPI001E649B14|nr:potassium channel family protein [Subtercola endophyticus]UFS57910.1 potassium channel family protein [Subtercola endophyticus]
MSTERGANPRMTQQRWQALTNWPLTGAAVLFLVAYSFKVILNQPGFTQTFLYAVMIVVWAAFLINYIINVVLAGPTRAQWVRKNWYQIPITLLPALEPLRLLRLVKLTDLLPSKTEGNRLRSRIGLYVISTLVLVIYVGALGVLDAEQNARGANILTLGDALWWAIVTVTTVGYGDYVPITTQGRLIAAALMLTGVALIGTITGTLASFLGERSRAHDDARLTASKKQVDDLAVQIARLEQLMLPRGDSAADTPARPAAAPAAPAAASPQNATGEASADD